MLTQFFVEIDNIKCDDFGYSSSNFNRACVLWASIVERCTQFLRLVWLKCVCVCFQWEMRFRALLSSDPIMNAHDCCCCWISADELVDFDRLDCRNGSIFNQLLKQSERTIQTFIDDRCVAQKGFSVCIWRLLIVASVWMIASTGAFSVVTEAKWVTIN